MVMKRLVNWKIDHLQVGHLAQKRTPCPWAVPGYSCAVPAEDDVDVNFYVCVCRVRVRPWALDSTRARSPRRSYCCSVRCEMSVVTVCIGAGCQIKVFIDERTACWVSTARWALTTNTHPCINPSKVALPTDTFLTLTHPRWAANDCPPYRCVRCIAASPSSAREFWIFSNVWACNTSTCARGKWVENMVESRVAHHHKNKTSVCMAHRLAYLMSFTLRHVDRLRNWPVCAGCSCR